MSLDLIDRANEIVREAHRGEGIGAILGLLPRVTADCGGESVGVEFPSDLAVSDQATPWNMLGMAIERRLQSIGKLIGVSISTEGGRTSVTVFFEPAAANG